MPLIDGEEWRSLWLAKRHVCLYPVFEHFAQLSLPPPSSSLTYKNLANETVRNIKTLLLFNDHVDVLLWRLFVPITKRAKRFFNEMFENEDFLGILNNGLIATGLWNHNDFYKICTAIVDEDRHIFGVPEDLGLLEHIHKLSKTNMVFFDARNDDSPIYDELFANIKAVMDDNLFEFDPVQRDALLPIVTIGSSPSPGDYWFRYASMGHKIGPLLSDPRVQAFYYQTSLSLYEIGDRQPNRLIVPYLGSKWGDSPLRTSEIAKSLVVLQSPDFMRHFLALFIDDYVAQRVGLLSYQDLVDLHSQPFWRGFLDDYHSAASIVSTVTSTLPEDLIAQAVGDEFRRVMTRKLSRSMDSVEFLIGATFSLLSLLHVPRLPLPPKAKQWVERFKGRSQMYVAHPDLQRFLVWIEKRVKRRAHVPS